MFRFSRDKRFFGKFSLSEFTSTAECVIRLLRRTRPYLTVEVLTTETKEVYRLSQITFVTDETQKAQAIRPRYEFEELKHDVWERSYSIDVLLKNPRDLQPNMMVALSLDREADGRSLKFSGQMIDQVTADQIVAQFGKPDCWYAIGDGLPKNSAANLNYGLDLLRTREL